MALEPYSPIDLALSKGHPLSLRKYSAGSVALTPVDAYIVLLIHYNRNSSYSRRRKSRLLQH